MMKVTDNNITSVSKNIKEELDKLRSDEKRLTPVTNMNLELFNTRYNLHVTSLNNLDFLYNFLKVFPDNVVIGGFTVKEWITDIRTTITNLNNRNRINELESALQSLDKLYSEEARTQKEFDNILSILK